MNVTAIIPAGGSGRRMGTAEAKQYLLLHGLPLLVHTLRPFQEAAVIVEIILVVPAGDVTKTMTDIVVPHGLTKVRKVVAGGRERQDSVANAIAVLEEDTDMVVIHDAARPFVSPALIEAAVHASIQAGAVVVGIPARDTVKRCDRAGRVIGTLPRELIWLAQTPQVFRRETIVAAHRRARADNFYGTDDAALVERLGITVRMIEGSPQNIKITTADDLVWAEHILSASQ
ncbi:MAG TPA: 2-C-methyl-D-erythritol 4-phosphate cytidylyltransferase [Syntrophales bacterium]|nr:2-C-methyl-D-erythritol 4-phosphate cytidylyltransferase [Syntrophales bacterium]HRU88004.1 2-C-methyl-D-erythritol 4-phosphate cytidylyltransferase [Syntrophales bacterium]